MGGHALKNTPCIRIDKNTYKNVKTEILSKLPFCHEVHEIPEKDDFGDIDLLYVTNENIKKIVIDLFHPKEMIQNGPVFSFSFELNKDKFVQIDLIKVHDIEMASFYYGYGDVPVFLGIMLKKNGLTFGEDGISILYKNHKILLTSNPNEIMNFLEMDTLRDFKTQNDVFKWTCSCCFFKPEYFQYDSFNHHYRDILKRRPVFQNFVTFALTQPPSINCKKKEIDDYIHFFKKDDEREKINEILYINKLYSDKMSGRIFMKYVKEMKEIGKMKKAFEEYISKNENIIHYLENNTNEKIENDIQHFLSHVKI